MKTSTIFPLLIIFLAIGCKKQSNDIMINTPSPTTTFTDTRDGTTYRCVTIGSQTWFAENLRYRLPLGSFEGCTTYAEPNIDTTKIVVDKTAFNDSITKIVNEGSKNTPDLLLFSQLFLHPRSQYYDYSLNSFMSAYISDPTGDTFGEYFAGIMPTISRINNKLMDKEIIQLANKNFDEDYVKEYGYLYSYKAALKAIPKGWRLPTDEDWKRLESYIKMQTEEINLLEEWRGNNQGELLINSVNLGFNAKMAGGQAYGLTSGHAKHSFINKGVKGYFWTSTPSQEIDSLPTTIIRTLQFNNKKIYRGTTVNPPYNDRKKVYFSVRCIKE